MKLWRDLLIALKSHFFESGRNSRFIPYKFLGDGWILLFDDDVTVEDLFTEFTELYGAFLIQFSLRVKKHLQRIPDRQGLTFGIDTGTLVTMEMDGEHEYVGRPINVASRLQAELKSIDKVPEGKALISAPFYGRHVGFFSKATTTAVKVSLRNIADGNQIRAYKHELR